MRFSMTPFYLLQNQYVYDARLAYKIKHLAV